MNGGGESEMESVTVSDNGREEARQTPASSMRLWTVVVVLVQWIAAGSEGDHLLTYGPEKETLLTLEGEDRSETRVYRQKFKRFLSFNNDESNIRVEMVFAVPFLHIPIGGKPVGGPFGNGVTPMVDINAKSLLTASVLLFMLFFVIPKIVRVFVPTYPDGRGFEESEVSRVMRGVESALRINATACWQQGVCSLVQASRHDGTPSNWGKIVDGISNIQWVEKMAAGTSFGEAMMSAKSEADGCKLFYSQCPLNTEKLGYFVRDLARRYMNHLIQLSNDKNRHK